MKIRRIHEVMVVLAVILFGCGIEAADQWPSGTELTYFYCSTNEPTGAGTEVNSAASAWNAGLNCFSFTEAGGLGYINWISDQDFWKEHASTNAPGFAVTDWSTHFYVYLNVAYFAESQWSTSCASGKLDVKSIALHELGHVLGLDDCLGCTGTVMKTPYSLSTPDCWSGPFDGDKTAVNSWCPNPAATVYGFSVSGGIARWRATSQYETQRYVVEGAPFPGGPWQAEAVDQPTVGDHEVAVGPYSYYRLLEVEQDGGMLIHGIAVDAQPSERVTVERPSLEKMRAILAGRKAELLAATGLLKQGADRLLIVTNEALSEVCTYGIAEYWSLRGVSVSMLTVDGFDPDPSVRRAHLRNAIVDSVSAGVNCILFVGDSNDHVQFDMAKEGPQWWPETWEGIHANYLAAGFPSDGQPSHDLLPAWYEPDTLPRGQNTAYTLPYVPYLGRYADMDGDEIPDIPWGCLPFTTVEQVAGYACKLWSLCPTTAGTGDVAFYVCDRDYSFIGDGAIARAAADSVEAALPSWVGRHHLYVSDVPDDSQRNIEAANLWNQSAAGIHMLMGAYSNRYVPADFFDKTNYLNPWHMEMIISNNNYYPLVIANSCSGGDWARTEDPDIGRPILEDFLAAHDRGALAWVGPSVGTWQHANVIFGEYLLEELYADPGRSMAASFIAAQRRMLEDTELNNATKLVAKMMCFFGDPLAPINEIAVITEASKPDIPSVFRLEQNIPNPFNPITTIRYSIPTPGHVRLKIYNVAGQLVRTLVDEEQSPRAGGYSMTWNGENDAGRRVASGVYFYQLTVNRYSRTKKLVILK